MDKKKVEWKIRPYESSHRKRKGYDGYDILHCQKIEDDLRIYCFEKKTYISTAYLCEDNLKYDGACPNCGEQVPNHIKLQMSLLD